MKQNQATWAREVSVSVPPCQSCAPCTVNPQAESRGRQKLAEVLQYTYTHEVHEKNSCVSGAGLLASSFPESDSLGSPLSCNSCYWCLLGAFTCVNAGSCGTTCSFYDCQMSCQGAKEVEGPVGFVLLLRNKNTTCLYYFARRLFIYFWRMWLVAEKYAYILNIPEFSHLKLLTEDLCFGKVSTFCAYMLGKWYMLKPGNGSSSTSSLA